MNTSPDLKVLQIISGLDIGGFHGGAERFGVELSRALKKQYVDVHLAAFWRRRTAVEDHWARLLAKEGIEVFFAAPWRGKTRLDRYLAGLLALRAYCASNAFHIAHSHFQIGTLAALCAKATHAVPRVVRTAHITLEWGEGPIAWLLRRTLTDWLFPASVDLEVGVSQAVCDQLSSHPGARLLRRKPLHIPNAISAPAESASATLPRRQAQGNQGPVIGSIGRLTRQKGYRFLIEAAPAVLERFPHSRFVLIGDGPLRDDLHQRVKALGLEAAFEFLGQVQDVTPLLSDMDLFVLPSLWEGLPTVLLESMACGVPVVATAVPGTDELVQDDVTGWLVPPRDPSALAQKIIFALSSPGARGRVAQAAFQTAKSYQIGQIAREYLEAYARIDIHPPKGRQNGS